jgi:hypothetical protein
MFNLLHSVRQFAAVHIMIINWYEKEQVLFGSNIVAQLIKLMEHDRIFMILVMRLATLE